MQVRKSDGSYEEFKCDKVKSGVFAAYKKCKQEYDDKVGDSICETLVLYDGITTEEIRQQVEDQLMGINKKVAKSYIKYGEDEAFIKDRVRYMENYANNDENAASSSETDPNANVTNKNVANLDGEVYKMQNRKTQRYKMMKELLKSYPEVAKDYVKDLENHIIYAHDEASGPSDKNYCEAVSLYPLLVDGTRNMDGLNTTAPKNLSSFCGQMVNLTFLLASQCKGAVAFGEFFNVLDFYCAKEFGDDYINHLDEFADSNIVKNKKTVLQKIHQAYQAIVFGWNQPSGNRSSQSPFTNISYYDSGYWHAMFDSFYFPDGTQPKWERVSFLQKDFMRWFCEERSKTLLTFPVETMALLTDGKDVIDKEYKEFTAEMWAKGHSFFLYLSDTPDSLASCCFDGSTEVVYLSDIVNNERCIETATLKDLYDKYHGKTIDVLYSNPYDCDVSWEKATPIKVKSSIEYEFSIENGEKIIVTHDHIFPIIREENVVENMISDDIMIGDKFVLNNGETLKIINIEKREVVDKEFYCLTMEDKEKPYFTLKNHIITHNCRLRNKIEKNVFSFTNGLTGVKTGSANVITLNLNRIIQNYYRGIGDGDNSPKKRVYKTEGFERYFKNIVQRVIKYHKAFKDRLYEAEKKGLLTASKAGYITMDKLFSTIGVNGFNESAEFVGLTCSYNDDYKEYCQYITGLISNEEAKETDPKYKMNLEFVPGESLGGKNYRWDKSDGYWVPSDRVLYNSYFYLADNEKTSPIDKLKMHGKDFTRNLSGGVGCHINLDKHLSKEQYLKLMDVAIKYGTSYYTFNVLNSSCDSCGYISKEHIDKCPVCGSESITDWTRIIGYLRPISAFEKARKIEASKRVYSKTID